MRSLILLVVLLLSTPSCATSGNPSVTREEMTSQIKMGMSTKEDVRKLFGAPNVVSRTLMSPVVGVSTSPTSMEIWTYAYTDISTSPVTFIAVVGLFAGSSTINTASLAVSFDDKGIVQNVTTGQSQATGGPGASFGANP